MFMSAGYIRVSAEVHVYIPKLLERILLAKGIVYYVLQSCQCCYVFVQLAGRCHCQAEDSEGQAVAERPVDGQL